MNKITKQESNQAGFTLIEILVVIGIIAVLAAIVLVAINPARQFAQARDTERRSNVTAILDGVGQYIADNQGELPPSIDGMSDGDDDVIGDGSGQIDLCNDLVDDYLPAFPTDPDTGLGDLELSDCSSYNSGYNVIKNANGRVTIWAQADTDQDDDDDVDANDIISVTR